MSCVRCGEKKTIKAHLIPQVFCKEVQVGKAHATGVGEDGKFHVTQSGTFDKEILCAKCDGILEKLEDYTAKILRLIRENSIGLQIGPKVVSGIENEKILRFCAGILWKYSITKEEYGKIDLYGFQDEVYRIAYSEQEIPEWFNVAMFRLQTHPNDSGVFAYRAPLIDRKNRVRLYRFMLGGCLFFVKVHRKKMRDDPMPDLWLNGESTFKYCLFPAQKFEEFNMSKELAYNTESLSKFLDKQDALAESKT